MAVPEDTTNQNAIKMRTLSDQTWLNEKKQRENPINDSK